ncbi:hypothetical protein [Qipengyuania zhejiangensis]|uniref:hypothetical protein n=1 Tax=Qipengyuania zhejiangensis TaxID=3077782 RepID=UPI002D784F57|nr:hypothetical protein [Qipengyuania sp. Z2]
MIGVGNILSIAIRVIVFAAVMLVGYNYQLDRSQQKQLSMLALPGGIEGGFGDFQRARIALMSDPASALPLAEKVVRQRPVSAANLEILAIAAAEADEMDEAGAALQLAAQRGWRGEYTQSAAVAGAVAAGDYETAALRLEGLIRSGSSVEVSGNIAAAIAQVPEARAALADRMLASEPFRTQLSKATANLQGFAPVMSQLLELGGERQHDCTFLSQVAFSLLKEGLGVDGATGWPDRCAKALKAGELAPEVQDPFDWRLGKARGLSHNASAWREGINARNRSLVDQTAAYRYESLPAGNQVFEFVYEAGSRPGQGDARLEMACVRDGGNRPVSSTAQADLVTFAIPDDCPVQRLSVIVERGDFSALRVKRVGS